MIDLLTHIAPTRIKHLAKTLVRREINSRAILSSLHFPQAGGKDQLCFYDPISLKSASGSGLPIPPPDMRMGYCSDSNQAFLESGKRTADTAQSIIADYGLTLGPGDAILDWGCATGRVLRWFEKEARNGVSCWGVDQHEPSISWNKENLCPPFHFGTCSAIPHLPFEDRKFKLVLAYSVFTHIEHLRDMWLMEISRITAKGGIFLATIHDEHTIAYFQQTGKPCWIPPGVSLASLLRHEVSIISGLDWGNCYTFFLSDWAIREFGRYFEVLAIRPRAEDYQTALILRKR
jgi:ubiquinone/menaquinone biosynthesis C-methylase UbiE